MDIYTKYTSIIDTLQNEESISNMITFDFIRQNEIDSIKQIADVLQSVYPDNWDIQLRISTIRTPIIRVVIYFPFITIDNGFQSHLIRDLYFSFQIYKGHEFKITALSGARTKVSYGEFLSGYKHSHLESVNYQKYNMDYTNFCLGDGEINQTVLMCNASFDVNIFLLFLLQIKTYLSWESLDGGPHIKMEKVFTKGSDYNIPTFTLQQVYDAFLQYWYRVDYKDLSQLEITVNGNGFIQIVDNDEFEDYCLRITSGIVFDDYKCYRDNDKKYCGAITDIKQFDTIPTGKLDFRNKEISFEVDYTIPDTFGKKYLHPTFKNCIKQKIQYELNKQKIKSIAFR